jgi:two-component system, sensor histidine kinase and response regulator
MKSKDPVPIKADILVVDDTPANLQLLSSILVKCGFQVRSVINGNLALEAARRRSPSLILLDVQMPKMDGYEVCKQLKNDERLKDIPVIFVSAHGAIDDKVKGFQSGGVDYITKPYQAEEIQSRILTHLEIRRTQMEARIKNASLERLVQLRNRQLQETNQKLAGLDNAKNQFLAIVSHELRTPLHGLVGAAELAFSESLDHPRLTEYKKIFDDSRQRILLFVEDALLLSNMQVKGGQFVENNSHLDDIIETTINECRETAEAFEVELRSGVTRGLGQVLGDWYFLTRALTRLIETGIKFSMPHKTVLISAFPMEQEVLLQINASGYSVPDKELPDFFELLNIGRALTPRGDLGLSPAVAGQIINLLGGWVKIKNTSPSGIEIVAKLPRYKSHEVHR